MDCKRHLVITEIVAQHELVDNRDNFVVVEEVDALNTTCAVANVTIQLQTVHLIKPTQNINPITSKLVITSGPATCVVWHRF